MSHSHIIHISSLPPTACGIAEYAAVLVKAIHSEYSQVKSFKVRLDFDAHKTWLDCQQIAVNPLDQTTIESAVKIINQFRQKTVLLQHEFKLYGGENGENVSWLFQTLDCPIVATLHTIWPVFPPARQRVFLEVLQRSNRLIVFTELAAEILRVNYKVATEKICVIPHGVPDVPFTQPGTVEWSNVPKRSVRFITIGLLRPTKGIEAVIAALAEVKKQFSDFAYIICGADHPRNASAREYRNKLLTMVSSHGLENHVFFVNVFLDSTELIKAIQSSDAVILPYTASEQSSSGVLALALGCGRPVIATNFQHARAVLNDENGLLVPIGHVNALAPAIELLARDCDKRKEMARASYNLSRSWIWPEVAQRHFDLLDKLNGESL